MGKAISANKVCIVVRVHLMTLGLADVKFILDGEQEQEVQLKKQIGGLENKFPILSQES